MEDQYTILCVDDEESILRSLKRVLEMNGFHVLTALRGAEGLKVLETEPVDMVISDQRMPEMSGFEFLKQVLEKYPACIRIMLSGYSDFESLVHSVNEGEIVRYISKPWDNERLLATLREVFNKERLLIKLKKILNNIHEFIQVTNGLKIETIQEGDTIILKVSVEEQLNSQKEVVQLLELVLKIFEKNEPQFDVLSRSLSKEENTVILDVDLGNGVKLKIVIPNPVVKNGANGDSKKKG